MVGCNKFRGRVYFSNLQVNGGQPLQTGMKQWPHLLVVTVLYQPDGIAGRLVHTLTVLCAHVHVHDCFLVGRSLLYRFGVVDG